MNDEETKELQRQRALLRQRVRKQRIRDRKGVNSFMRSMNDTYRKRMRYTELSPALDPPSAQPELTDTAVSGDAHVKSGIEPTKKVID